VKSEIQGGIEFFEDEEGRQGEQCARCGSSADFEDCWECGGEGTVERDDWEGFADDRAILLPCEVCRGNGGWWRCISGRDWCESNPITGRESIESTALTNPGLPSVGPKKEEQP